MDNYDHLKDEIAELTAERDELIEKGKSIMEGYNELNARAAGLLKERDELRIRNMKLGEGIQELAVIKFNLEEQNTELRDGLRVLGDTILAYLQDVGDEDDIVKAVKKHRHLLEPKEAE